MEIGRYYWPAETDMPNRTNAAYGWGWGWRENEEHLIFTPEQLLECFANLLADGVTVYESECIGHKRIVPFEDLEAGEITLEITKKAGEVLLRDISLY